MGDVTAIAWTKHTWNPWQGCDKVSPGCKNCYMYADKYRYKQDPTVVVRSSPGTFNRPLRTGKTRWLPGDLVFTCSWSDFFHEAADPWRGEAWDIVRATPWLTYQILTKRLELVRDRLPADWGAGYPNVWLGASVENQRYAYRARQLQELPARVRFLSVEPMLGPVDLRAVRSAPADLLDGDRTTDVLAGEVHTGDGWARDASAVEATLPHHRPAIDWVIVGGESQKGARPCETAWIDDVVRDCRDTGVAVFVKQLGALAGCRHHAGADPSEWPERLRVREFPAVYRAA